MTEQVNYNYMNLLHFISDFSEKGSHSLHQHGEELFKLSNALGQEIDRLKEDGNLSLEAREAHLSLYKTKQKKTEFAIPKVEIGKRSLNVFNQNLENRLQLYSLSGTDAEYVSNMLVSEIEYILKQAGIKRPVIAAAAGSGSLLS